MGVDAMIHGLWLLGNGRMVDRYMIHWRMVHGCMLVTCETSQDPIGPFGLFEQSPIADSAKHDGTAALSSSLDWGAKPALDRGDACRTRC